LKKIIEDNNIKILHCHLTKSLFFGWLLKNFFFRDIKIIYHEHGEIFTNRFYNSAILKYTQSDIDLYLAVSNTTKHKLICNANIQADKIKVLYNAIDFSKFTSKKKKTSFQQRELVIGFSGRLATVKGCNILLKSLPLIKFPYKVLIAGSGPLLNETKKLAEKLGIDANVNFLGYINNIQDFYSKIDVLIVPSKHESFGISVIESQSMKIPVIASDVGSLNEIILNGETGLLFKEGDYHDLAKKISYLRNDLAIYEKIVNNARKNVRQYSFDIYMKKLNNIYEKI